GGIRRNTDGQGNFALIQRKLRYLGGDGGQVLQGAQRRPDDDHAQQPRGDQPRTGHDHGGGCQGSQGVLLARQGQSGNDGAPVFRVSVGNQTVFADRERVVNRRRIYRQGGEDRYIRRRQILPVSVCRKQPGAPDLSIADTGVKGAGSLCGNVQQVSG